MALKSMRNRHGRRATWVRMRTRHRTPRFEPFDPNPFEGHEPAPDVSTHYRDPDWKGWTFVPTIKFATPVDVVKLLGRDDDDNTIR